MLDPVVFLYIERMQNFKTTKQISAGGVVFNRQDQKLLMIQVQNIGGTLVWTFAKGHQETGETLQESALREVLEETGWQCEVVPLTGNNLMFYQARYFFSQKNKDRVDKRVTWFLMQPLQKTGTHDADEVQKVEWFSLQEAGEKLSYDSDKKLMELLLKFLGG